MKIDEIYKQLSLIGSSSDAASTKKSEGREGNAQDIQGVSGSGTQVELSTTSMEFSKVTAMMDGASPDRLEKVDQIREKIAAGQYEVEGTRVADKILQQTLVDFLK